MREAFAKKQNIVIKSEEEKKKKEPPKKKTPLTPETREKLKKAGVNVLQIHTEEDGLAKLESLKPKEEVEAKTEEKKDASEKIRDEALALAKILEINATDAVGTKAILEAIKSKIEQRKGLAGNDTAKMAEVISIERRYKSICTEEEVLKNTNSRLGVATLADYNRFRLGL